MPAPSRVVAYALELTPTGMRRTVRFDDGTYGPPLDLDIAIIAWDQERGIVETMAQPTLPERNLDDSPQDRQDATVLHDQ